MSTKHTKTFQGEALNTQLCCENGNKGSSYALERAIKLNKRMIDKELGKEHQRASGRIVAWEGRK